tara:strand:- start:2446 stop:2979 length:534 start_codon:yes stop_codon:yes gene_type:complete
MEILRSPYLHISLLLGLSSLAWNAKSWENHITSISPSLLGFTLAGYTVFIASVSGRLLKGLIKAKASDGHSYFQKVNSAFFHFIFVQCVATLYAITFPALTSFSLPLLLGGLPFAAQFNSAGYCLLNFLGWVLLFYSILVVVAVLIWIYRIINLNEQAVLKDLKDEGSGADPKTPAN